MLCENNLFLMATYYILMDQKFIEPCQENHTLNLNIMQASTANIHFTFSHFFQYGPCHRFYGRKQHFTHIVLGIFRLVTFELLVPRSTIFGIKIVLFFKVLFLEPIFGTYITDLKIPIALWVKHQQNLLLNPSVWGRCHRM